MNTYIIFEERVLSAAIHHENRRQIKAREVLWENVSVVVLCIFLTEELWRIQVFPWGSATPVGIC